MKSNYFQNFSLRVWLAAFVLLSAGGLPVWSQDNSFPLPAALTDFDVWEQPGFLSAWRPAKTPSSIAHKIWPSTPVIFGRRPHYISGHFINGRLEAITLLFLDSGTHFGYVSQDRAAANEKMNRDSFQALHSDTAEKVLAGMEKLAESKGRPQTLGLTSMLKQEVLLFKSGKLTARYFSIPEQLVKVTFYREEKKRSLSFWIRQLRIRIVATGKSNCPRI